MAKAKKNPVMKRGQYEKQIVMAYNGQVASMIAKPLSDKTIVKIARLSFNLLAHDLQMKHAVRTNIGKFDVHKRNARKARNPQTGKMMTVPAHNSPVFQASATLKRLVNEK